MSTNEIYRVINLICSYITDKLSDGCGTLIQSRSRIHAQTLFCYAQEHTGCTEQLFIQALSQIKQKFPKKYNRIDLPTRWDGGSHIAFPEAYPDKDKICCKVCSPIDSNLIYLGTNRMFEKGMFIYVPRNLPSVITMLTTGQLEIVDTE